MSNLSALDQSKNGQKIDPSELITLDDIYPFYKLDPNIFDPGSYESIENTKKMNIQICLNRINRYLGEIKPLWPKASKLELYIAFGKCYNDPNEFVNSIDDAQFKKDVILSAKALENKVNQRNNDKSNASPIEEVNEKEFLTDDVDETLSESEEDESEYGEVHSQKKVNKTKEVEEKHDDNADYSFDSDDFETDDADDYAYRSGRKKNKKSKGKAIHEKQEKSSQKKTNKKSKFDFNKPKEIKQEEWESWSDAHKSSYLKGQKNPNAYFYRNLRPGEKRRNGKWTAEETKNFINRIKTMSKKNFYDSAPQWGIFSMEIPGRVGYQCANFYRNLVLEGKLVDPRYKIVDGKLKYIAFHQQNNKRTKSSYKRSKKRVQENDEASMDSNFSNENPGEEHLSLYERLARENPLKGAIDGITKEEIRVPALSPDGYLLDYNTWLKVITQTGKDPYTTHQLTKRSLTILNYDNIDQYRDKIKNLVIDA